jgi:hypothetical protein
LSSEDEFVGMAYYQDFREQCWVISNLDIVSLAYKKQFQSAFQRLLNLYPRTRIDFFEFSSHNRRKAGLSGQKLVLLDFFDQVLLVDPENEEIIECQYNDLEAFGPFEIIRELPFPDDKRHQSHR